MEECGITSVASNSIELRWELDSNLIQMRFTREGLEITAEDAAWLVDQTERFARGRTHIGFLVDCKGLEHTDAGWRATLADLFRGAAFRCWIAWFNTSRLIQVTVEMFAVATNIVEGQAFGSETAARAWLRERGVG